LIVRPPGTIDIAQDRAAKEILQCASLNKTHLCARMRSNKRRLSPWSEANASNWSDARVPPNRTAKLPNGEFGTRRA
jgi:hypothetical protein